MASDDVFRVLQARTSGATSAARVPRVAVDEGLECRLEVRTRVRLVDISLTGALLSSEAQLPVGTRAHMQAGVGSAPFAPDVQVQRIVDRPDP